MTRGAPHAFAGFVGEAARTTKRAGARRGRRARAPRGASETCAALRAAIASEGGRGAGTQVGRGERKVREGRERVGQGPLIVGWTMCPPRGRGRASGPRVGRGARARLARARSKRVPTSRGRSGTRGSLRASLARVALPRARRMLTPSRQRWRAGRRFARRRVVDWTTAVQRAASRGAERRRFGRRFARWVGMVRFDPLLAISNASSSSFCSLRRTVGRTSTPRRAHASLRGRASRPTPSPAPLPEPR